MSEDGDTMEDPVAVATITTMDSGKADERTDNSPSHGNPPANNGNNDYSENSKKRFKRDHTRRLHVSQEDLQGISLGSYAHIDMRQLFGVDLPLPPSPRQHQSSTEQEEPTTSVTTDAVIDSVSAGSSSRSKRKVAFLLGYVGTNYGGFQINPGQRTLQAELELVLFRCELLDERNFGYPNKYGWSTSARTDRGVHAAAQVCSAKIEMLPSQTVCDVRDVLNTALPADMRVLDVVRTTRNFCARIQRDRVRYQYMIPACMLSYSPEQLRAIFAVAGCPLLVAGGGNGDVTARKVAALWSSSSSSSDPLLTKDQIVALRMQLQHARVTPDQLESLQRAVQLYEGTHSFHNFTKGVLPTEARAKRYILEFKVNEPVIFETNGTQWIPTTVLGQSFLLHQIRKMVCLAMDVARGATPADTIIAAFSRRNPCPIRIGLAPAQGLFLDMSFYSNYNRRKNQNESLSDLDWGEGSTSSPEAYQLWKEFRDGVIMKHVVEEEDREGNFISHLYAQELMFHHDQQCGNKCQKAGSPTVPNADLTTFERIAQSAIGDVGAVGHKDGEGPDKPSEAS